MLLVGDLGLLCSLVVVVVGWLLARRKWRRAAARKEEIRRLMAFASEETARAELEAAAGYSSSYGSEPAAEEPLLGFGSSPGRQLQYQCELCFSPTTTRCKQCKAVHYCSRKCQIIHWRQGHKDECHSLVTQRKTDEGSHSHLKELKQDEIRSSGNIAGIEMTHTTKPVEPSSGDCMFPNPILNGVSESNDTETNDDGKRTERNGDEMSVASDSNLKDHKRYNGTSTSTNVEPRKPLSSVRNPEDRVTAPSILNQLNSGCINIDEKSESSTSSSCSSAVSEEHSLSEPSTPSDFWEGTVEPIRSKINALDEFHEFSMSNSRSSDRIHARVEISDDPSMPKKSEVSEDGLKPTLNCKPSVQNGVSNTSTECTSKDHISNGSVSSKHDVDAEQLDHKVCATNDNVNTMKSMQSDRAHGNNASCSLENGGYVQRSATNGTNPSVRKVVDNIRVSNFIMRGSLGAGSGVMGKYEGSFSYELFVKLYNWNKVELCPCGLVNCGNSCYANAVLQCLAFTPPLTAYFLQGLHAKACKTKEWCFTCDLGVLVMKSKEGDSPISPARIMSQMQHLGSHIGNGREEDAHEFLRCAIDAMQIACLKEAGVKVPSPLDEDTTLLGLTFGGYLESKIQCMRCGVKSKQHERIMDLTVEIGGEIGTLEDALRQFTRSEILDDENKYQCCRCKSYEKAKKKLRVLEAPNVLTIALKRFQSGKFGKLNKAVKFPDILNLAPYMSGTSDKSPIYQLYGVVVHLDVMNSTFSGHYICYIKNNAGRWFKADDRLVKPVELESVLSKDAYMLFYARCSPRAPRLIRSTTVPREHRKAKSQAWNFKSHPSNPWDVSAHRSSAHNASNGLPYRNNHAKNVEEDDVLSEYSSSFFSDGGSQSTESSNRGSSSTDDSFDQVLFCSDTTSPVSPLADVDSHSTSSSSSSSSCSSNRKIESSNRLLGNNKTSVYLRRSLS